MWERLVVRDHPPAPSDIPTAAVLAPLFEDTAGELRLVLTKRPMTMPTHAGHLAFPGGRPDPGDDGPVATALREAHEEMGIEPEDVELLGFLPEIHTVEYSLLVVPVVGRLPPNPTFTPSEREVDMVLTPRVDDLADDSRWTHQQWNGHRVWFYEIDGEILWGATAWMTRSLLGLET
jgi:8-oxo-dGTP pyrophosphatase MutT (NUDIX family)